MKKWLATFVFTFCLTGLVLAQAALDPSRLAVGARSLGLGRTFIALADDVNAIFQNPAGLAGLSRWQLTSMSGKFAEEFTYFILTGAYPTDYGVLGIGFVGGGTGGVPVAKVLEGTEADPVLVVDTTQQPMDYSNNVYFLSWGKSFSEIYGYKVPWNLSLGANLKIFQTSLSGDKIIDGVGSGSDLDLGIKLKPNPWLQLGGSARNILPSSLGGKLTYASGYSEYYPMTLILGSAVNLLGDKKDSLRQFGKQKLVGLLDLEYNRGLPLLMHLGFEWTPYQVFSLRFGIDQDASSDPAGKKTTENGLAYGVALNYGGFRFDYAYHRFPGLPDVDNHFFSFTYGLFEKKVEKEKLTVTAPPDRLVTFESAVALVGTVNDEEINNLLAQGIKLSFGLNGRFETTVSLAEGKNSIRLQGKRGEELLASRRINVLRLKRFPDVEVDYWAARPISLLAMQKIITGYPDVTFRPEGNITRAEICSLLIKTRWTTDEGRGTTEEASAFADVPASHWAAKFVKDASKRGVVKGYPDGTFRPGGNITRAEGLAMVARFAGIQEDPYTNEFPDIDARHWAAKIIAGAKLEGLLKYLEGRNFEPSRLLSRAETVEMLQRTTVVQDILSKDLLNWDTY